MKDNNILPHKAYLLSIGKRYSDLNKEEMSKYNRLYRDQYYPANRERIQKHNKRWRDDNPEYEPSRGNKWPANNPEAYRKYRRKNAGKMRQYRKDKWAEDKHNLSVERKLQRWLARCAWRTGVQGTFEEVVGCNHDEFIEYIESLFTEGMTWDNWGKGKGDTKWHIDHIIAVNNGGSHSLY